MALAGTFTSNSISSTVTPIFALPSAPSSGDYLVALVETAAVVDWVQPAGWTQLVNVRAGTTSTGNRSAIWVKDSDGTEGASISCQTGSGTARAGTIDAWVITGADSTLTQTSSYGSGTTSVTSVPIPGITVGSSDAWILGTSGQINAAGTSVFTVPTSPGTWTTVTSRDVTDTGPDCVFTRATGVPSGATGILDYVTATATRRCGVIVTVELAGGAASVAGDATLTSSSTLAVNGSSTVAAAAALSTASTLTSAGSATEVAAAVLATTSTLAVTGADRQVAAATLTTASTLAATGGRTAPGAAALTSSCTLTATGASAAVPKAVGAIIPAYWYPSYLGSDWDVLVANPGPNTVAIANIGASGGPGTAVNSDYTTAIGNAVAAGIKIIGYVDTAWGTRALGASSDDASTNTIYGDINAWVAYYGTNIGGFFFDQSPSDTSHLSVIQSAAAYARTKVAGAFLVTNQGAYPADSGYIDAVDVSMCFEGDYTAAAYAALTVPAYATTYVAANPPGKFGHLVYNASVGQAANVFAVAASCNAGWVYATSAGALLDALASYWVTSESTWYALNTTGSATLTTGATLTAAASGSDSAALTSASTLTAAGSSASTDTGALTTGVSLTVTGALTVPAAAGLTSTSSLAASSLGVPAGAAILVTGSTLTAAETTSATGTAALATSSSLTVAGAGTQGATAALASTCGLTANGLPAELAAAALATSCALVVAAAVGGQAGATLANASTLTVSGSGTASAGAALATGATLAASGGLIATGLITLLTQVTLTADATQILRPSGRASSAGPLAGGGPGIASAVGAIMAPGRALAQGATGRSSA